MGYNFASKTAHKNDKIQRNFSVIGVLFNLFNITCTVQYEEQEQQHEQQQHQRHEQQEQQQSQHLTKADRRIDVDSEPR